MAESISVIIPAYNSGAFVAEAIDSALTQTAPPAEVIIVDDGSTDDTAGRVARYGPPVYYFRQRNQGVATARNCGLRLARGDFIAFLDADDVWHPSKLERQLECLRQRPEVGLLGTGVFRWHGLESHAATAGGEGSPTTRSEPLLEPVELPRLLVRNYFTTSSMIVRRTIIERAGDFDAQLHGPEDYDMWLRIAEITQAAILREPLTGYRHVPKSLSQQPEAMEAGMRRILEKLDERRAWRGRRLLRRRAWSHFDYSCAHMYGAAGERATAVGRMLRSMMRYPLPYSRGEARVALARPRRLAVLTLRMMGAMRAEGA